jgi:hypothetical protein
MAFPIVYNITRNAQVALPRAWCVMRHHPPVRYQLLLCVAVVACNHSTPFSYGYTLGARTTGADILLTYNPQPDYWPTLTGDSTGILYAFVPVNAGPQPLHRCMGVMPVTGGQRYWEWCDSAATRTDSLGSFPAYAMAADGRLIYLETSVSVQIAFAPPDARLWLADSAFPYRRRLLDTFPVTVGDSTVNWLADLKWTGPASFLALGQRMVILGHCTCSQFDSVFYGESVIKGSVGASGATLAAVPGTTGATGYSLADDGASIVFTRRNSVDLMKVPVEGGSPVIAAVVTSDAGMQLLGLSCRSAICVVAVGTASVDDAVPSALGTYQLRRVPLNGDSVVVLRSQSLSAGILSSPLYAPSGDVVANVGDIIGHLRTYSSNAVDLHLFPGLVH